jgi:hypothetical protein
MLGSGHEPAGNRRLGGARRGLLNADPDWFQAGRVAAGGQLGQHSLQCQLIQQLGRGERLVGRHRQLPGAISRTDWGPTDPYAAAAEGHLARLAAVPHCRSGRVVAALGADQPGHILLQHGLEHLQARPYCQREQASRAALASSATATVTCSGSWS